MKRGRLVRRGMLVVMIDYFFGECYVCRVI